MKPAQSIPLFPGVDLPATKERLRAYRSECREWPKDRMEEIPLKDYVSPSGSTTFRAWRSRDFLAQLAREESGALRLSVNRTAVTGDTRGRGRLDWKAGITWDEMLWVKRACGFESDWAVEIYPPDDELIDVANMRHLWLLDEAPPEAWRKSRPRTDVSDSTAPTDPTGSGRPLNPDECP